VEKIIVFRDIGKLTLGAGIGQLITLMAAPIIARTFGPEAFGQQSAMMSIASPMVALTSMAFPIAIVISQSDREALALSRMAFLGSLIMAPLATAALLVNNMWLLRLMNLDAIGAFAILIPVIVVLNTMTMSAGYLMIRCGAYGHSAWASVSAAAVGSLSKLALGLAWPGAVSLIAGNALGYLVGPLMALPLRRRIMAGQHRQSSANIVELARRHRDFPLYRAPQNFIAAVSQSLPIVGLTAGFGAASAGHYAIAIAIAGAPIALVGNAAQSVLYPRLNEVDRTGGDVTRLLVRSTLGLFALGAPFFLAIAALGPWLFSLIFGPEWREAGVFSALMVPMLWMGLANRPAVSLIPTLGRQRGLLIYEILGTAAKISALLIGFVMFGSARWAVGVFSAVGALAYVLLIAWVFSALRKKV
jgi:O-antigen/teichoic acid export membrane protein